MKWFQKISKRAWLLVFLIFLSAVLTPWIWAQIDAWMVVQKQAIWKQVESVLGESVVYDRLSPNFIEALEFQNVRILRSDRSVLATMAGLRFQIDWWEVFSGRFDRALKKIQMINGDFSLDEEIDRNFLERLRTTFQTPSQPLVVQIEGFNLNGTFKSRSGEWKLQRGFIVLADSKGGYRLQVRAGFQARWQTSPYGLTQLSGGFRGELTTDRAFSRFALLGESTKITSNIADLEPIKFQVVLTPESIEFNKVQDQVPLDLKMTWDRTHQKIQADLQAERFSISSLVHWKNEKTVASWLDTLWTGKIQYNYDLVSGGWALDLQGDAEFNNTFLPAGSHLRGEINGGPQQIVFHNTQFVSPELELSFNGNIDTRSWLPDGHLSLNRLDMPQIGTAEAQVDFQRTGNSVSMVCTDARFQTLRFQSLVGQFRRSTNGYEYSVDSSFETGKETNAEIKFHGTGSFQSGFVPIDFEIGNVPFSTIDREWVSRKFPGKIPTELYPLVLKASGHVELGPNHLSVFPSTWEFQDPEHADRRGFISVQFVDQILSIARLELRWDQASLDGQANINFSDRNKVVWNSQWGWQGKSITVNGDYRWSEKRLTWNGPSGISGYFRSFYENSWEAATDIVGFPLPGDTSLSFHFEGLGDGDRWSGKLNRVHVASFYPWNKEPFDLNVEGTLSEEELKFPSVKIHDAYGDLEGSLTTAWDFKFRSEWSGGFSLKNQDEKWNAHWTLGSLQSLKFEMTTSESPLERLFPPPLKGKWGALVGIQWQNGVLNWSVNSTFSQARWGNDPVGFHMETKGTADEIKVEKVNLSINPIQIQNGQIQILLKEGKWDASADSSVRVGTGEWKSLLRTQGNWSQRTDHGPLVETKILSTNNSWAGKVIADWEASASYDDGAWDAQLVDGSFRISGGVEGRIQAEGRAPFPVVFDAEGTIANGEADLHVKNFEADLATFQEVANSKLFRIKEGVLKGQLDVKGPLNDPSFNGVASIENLAFDTIFIRQTLGPFVCPLEFTDKMIRIPQVNVAPEGQFWNVSGFVRLDHFLPEAYEFNVETAGLSYVPVAYNFTGLNAEGYVSGKLTLRGSPISATLSSRLVLQESEIALGASEDLGTSSDYFGLNLDLVLTTGRKVEFVWPTKNLPLVRAIAAVGQTLTIKANEALSTFSVDGKIDLRAGEIDYLSQTFLVREGAITFQENQNTFDPRLSVRAELKKREAEGQVIINLRVDDPLSRFSPRFDANPYKTPEELQQLIGSTLALPSEYSKANDFNAALSLASDVGTGFILRPFEESVKKTFGLDLFTIRTDVLKKSLLNRNGPQDASAYLDNTRIFFGKYLGDEVFLQGSLNFEQDSSAALVAQPRLLMEPEFQLEFQTPFFLLNWTLLPKHPEDLFVSDNSVTFRWDWSY